MPGSGGRSGGRGVAAALPGTDEVGDHHPGEDQDAAGGDPPPHLLVEHQPVIEGATPPPPPKNLTVKDQGGRIVLSWQSDTSGRAKGYRVFRRTRPNEKYHLVHPGLLTKSSYSYNKSDADNGAEYVVRAEGSGGDLSGPSKSVVNGKQIRKKLRSRK